jgi:hypothetical protein
VALLNAVTYELKQVMPLISTPHNDDGTEEDRYHKHALWKEEEWTHTAVIAL